MVLVLIGLTGSAIVFDHALDAWLNPHLFTPRDRGAPQPLAAIIAAARAAVPDKDTRVSVTMPGVDYEVFIVALFDRPSPGQHARPTNVMVDPATAMVLGQRESGSNLTALVYRLHSSLLLRDVFGIANGGRYVVGIAGLGLLVSALTGLYLWRPRWHQVGQALGVKWRAGGKRLNFDLHRAGGFWSAPVLLVLAFSGVYLVFPAWVTSLIGAMARTEPRLRNPTSTLIPGALPISPDQAAAIAAARVPGGAPSWLDISSDPTAAYRVWLRRPRDVRRVYGDTIVWIDRWSGAVLSVRDRRALAPGDVILHWQFPLHSGEAFGLPGRLVIFFAGLIPLLLFVTGVSIWRRKRRVRSGRRARAQPLPPA